MSRRNLGRETAENTAKISRAALAAAAALFVMGQHVYGATLTWDNDPVTPSAQDGGGNWDLATLNWFDGTNNLAWNNAGNDVAVFGAGGTGGVVTLQQPATVIGGLTFNADGYTITGGSFTINGATPINLTTGIATISTAITGAGSVSYNVAGTSTLSVGTASTYTGGTSFAGGGTVDLTASGAAGLGTGSLSLGGIRLLLGTVGFGPQMNFVPGTTNLISINGNGTFGANAVATSGDGTVILENRGATPNNVVTMEGDNSAFVGTFQGSNSTLRFRRTTAGSANAVWDLGTTSSTGVAFITGNLTLPMGAVMGEAGSVMNSNIRGSDGATTLTYEVGAKGIDTTFNGTIQDNGTNKLTAIRKVGAGKWTLGGQNSYIGITEINGGTLALSSTGTLAVDVLGTPFGTPRVLVNTGGHFDVSAYTPYNVPSVQTIAGSGGTVHGNVNVGAGRVSPAGVSTTGTLTFANDLSLSGGLFELDFGTPDVIGNGSNDLIAVGGDLNLSSGVIQVAPLGAVTVGADYPLIQYTGSVLGSLGSITLAPATRANVQLQNDTVNKLIKLHVNSVSGAASLVWSGASGSNWDVGISQNWLNGATPDKYFQADMVTFSDASGVPTNVTLVGSVFPGSVTVDSSNNNYTFSGTGVIGGATSLVKSGTSILTISQTASNTYTGGTTINGGTIVLSTNQASLGTGSITLNDNTAFQFLAGGNNPLNVNGNATLIWGNNTNITYGGSLSGTGNVTVLSLGAGSLINYNGAMDQFSGTLNLGNITGGTFRLNSGGGNNAVGGPNLILDLGSSPVTVNNRNGTTISFGGLVGNSGPILSGAQTGTGVSTYSIGAANVSTTFAGIIQDGGASPNFAVTNVTKVGTATLTLSGNNTYTGATTVQAGKLVLMGNAKNPVLNAGSTSTTAGANVLGGRLILDYNDTGVAPDVKSILAAGYAQTPTKFATGALRTSNADVTSRGLGWKDDPTAKQETIAYTWYGDANLDGQVDVTDLGALATNWQTSNIWVGGDFNYDGFVDVTDLGALATNWQQGVGNPLGRQSLESAMAAVGLGNVSVPEPASIGLIGLGLAGFVSRRRRCGH